MVVKNLEFFDKEGYNLNLIWNDRYQIWEGNIFFPKVSVGLYENTTIYVVEYKGGDNSTDDVYTYPTGNGNIFFQWDLANTFVDEFFMFDFDENYELKDTSSLVYTPYDGPICETLIINRFDKYNVPLLNSSSNIEQDDLLEVHIAFRSDEKSAETTYKRTLVMSYEDDDEKYEIARITFFAETIEEDERLKVWNENLGYTLRTEDAIIFKQSDIHECMPDFEILNEKRKELMLEGSNIYPYIGGYKAILNAIKFFGYDNLNIVEYWRNINEYDSEFGKIYRTYVYSLKDRKTLSTKRKPITLNTKNFQKLNNISLVYNINHPEKVDGEKYDEYGLPNVIEDFDKDKRDDFVLTIEEALVKMFALKKKLNDEFMPGSTKIIDIIGEGNYFSLNLVGNNPQISTVNYVESKGYVDFTVFPDKYCYITENEDFGRYIAEKLGLHVDESIRNLENKSIDELIELYNNGSITEIDTKSLNIIIRNLLKEGNDKVCEFYEEYYNITYDNKYGDAKEFGLREMPEARNVYKDNMFDVSHIVGPSIINPLGTSVDFNVKDSIYYTPDASGNSLSEIYNTEQILSMRPYYDICVKIVYKTNDEGNVIVKNENYLWSHEKDLKYVLDDGIDEDALYYLNTIVFIITKIINTDTSESLNDEDSDIIDHNDKNEFNVGVYGEDEVTPDINICAKAILKGSFSENIDNTSIIEWKITHSERGWSESHTGVVKTHSDVFVQLPYLGNYDVEMVVWDTYNHCCKQFTKDAIIVEPYNIDIRGFYYDARPLPDVLKYDMMIPKEYLDNTEKEYKYYLWSKDCDGVNRGIVTRKRNPLEMSISDVFGEYVIDGLEGYTGLDNITDRDKKTWVSIVNTEDDRNDILKFSWLYSEDGKALYGVDEYNYVEELIDVPFDENDSYSPEWTKDELYNVIKNNVDNMYSWAIQEHLNVDDVNASMRNYKPDGTVSCKGPYYKFDVENILYKIEKGYKEYDHLNEEIINLEHGKHYKYVRYINSVVDIKPLTWVLLGFDFSRITGRLVDEKYPKWTLTMLGDELDPDEDLKKDKVITTHVGLYFTYLFEDEGVYKIKLEIKDINDNNYEIEKSIVIVDKNANYEMYHTLKDEYDKYLETKNERNFIYLN